MKILQIHNYYKSRGGETSVVNAEKELLESKGNEVIQLFSDNIHLKEIFREKKRFYSLLDRIIEEEKPDIAHIHNIFQIIGPEIFKYLHKRNMPVVMTIHKCRFLSPNGLFQDKNSKHLIF